MPACAFILMLVMLSLAIISLIGLWKSDSVLGLKWSVTFMLLMVVICFYTSFRNEPFEIEDEVAFIGVIATNTSMSSSSSCKDFGMMDNMTFAADSWNGVMAVPDDASSVFSSFSRIRAIKSGLVSISGMLNGVFIW